MRLENNRILDKEMKMCDKRTTEHWTEEMKNVWQNSGTLDRRKGEYPRSEGENFRSEPVLTFALFFPRLTGKK